MNGIRSWDITYNFAGILASYDHIPSQSLIFHLQIDDIFSQKYVNIIFHVWKCQHFPQYGVFSLTPIYIISISGVMYL